MFAMPVWAKGGETPAFVETEWCRVDHLECKGAPAMVSNRHERTLTAIFANPVRADIRWSDIEGLFRALGADITQGSGSRIRISLNGRRMTFHEPHPQPTIVKDAVRSVRRFLLEAGIGP
jgi:hypothetical protein